MNDRSALAIPHFVGAEVLAEVSAELNRQSKVRGTKWISAWDSDTGFAIVVGVIVGQVSVFVVRGPLDREDAAALIGVFEEQPVEEANRPHTIN